MQQGSRREFLRLAATTALAGRFLNLTVRPASSQELEGSQERDIPQAKPKALKLGLISDLNGSYGSTRYGPTVERGVALLKQHKPDLVLCAGDMVAGQNRALSDKQLRAMWRGFETSVRLPLQNVGIPLLPAIGNHDASSQRSRGSWTYARERVQASLFWQERRGALPPGLIEAENYPFFYAWQRPGLFIVVLDASSAAISSTQRQWLIDVLGSEHRRKDDLCLVVGHLPLTAFSEGRARAGECIDNAESLAAELRRARVDLVISGHHHAWYPSMALGLRLLSLGAMGSGPRRSIGSAKPASASLTLLDWSTSAQTVKETTLSLTNNLLPLQVATSPEQILVSGFPAARRRSTNWQRETWR